MDGIEPFDTVKTGAANIVVRRSGERISSGSAFLVGGKLLTSAHVLKGFAPTDEVELRFSHADAMGQNGSFRFPFGRLHLYTGGFSDEHSYDYYILDVPSIANNRYTFEFATTAPQIGEAVSILGYPFEHDNLTLHQGYVSSIYPSGVAEIIQLDMSVNASNSGGPLLRHHDGTVYGMVARKATGLTKAFDELIASFQENISAFEQAGDRIFMSGFDPFKVFSATQGQMRHVALELKRSSNVGIGYAIRATALSQESAIQS